MCRRHLYWSDASLRAQSNLLQNIFATETAPHCCFCVAIGGCWVRGIVGCRRQPGIKRQLLRLERQKIGTSNTLTMATMTVNGTPTLTKSLKLYCPGPTTSVFTGEEIRCHESRGRGQCYDHRERVGRSAEILGDGQRHRRHQHGGGRIGDKQAQRRGDSEQGRRYETQARQRSDHVVDRVGGKFDPACPLQRQ